MLTLIIKDSLGLTLPKQLVNANFDRYMQNLKAKV
jgi:hypothetical protein